MDIDTEPISEYRLYTVENLGNKPITLTPIKLSTRKSTIPNAGMGVFADEDIAANTYFIPPTNKYYTLSNDLAYDGGPYTINMVAHYTNVIFVADLMTTIGGGWHCFLSILSDRTKVSRQSKKDQELSRCYGPIFWFEHNVRLEPKYMFIVAMILCFLYAILLSANGIR
jgi:hypothetical protein